jgi:hypothetical protein
MDFVLNHNDIIEKSVKSVTDKRKVNSEAPKAYEISVNPFSKSAVRTTMDNALSDVGSHIQRASRTNSNITGVTYDKDVFGDNFNPNALSWENAKDLRAYVTKDGSKIAISGKFKDQAIRKGESGEVTMVIDRDSDQGRTALNMLQRGGMLSGTGKELVNALTTADYYHENLPVSGESFTPNVDSKLKITPSSSVNGKPISNKVEYNGNDVTIGYSGANYLTSISTPDINGESVASSYENIILAGQTKDSKIKPNFNDIVKYLTEYNVPEEEAYLYARLRGLGDKQGNMLPIQSLNTAINTYMNLIEDPTLRTKIGKLLMTYGNIDQGNPSEFYNRITDYSVNKQF